MGAVDECGEGKGRQVAGYGVDGVSTAAARGGVEAEDVHDRDVEGTNT